MKTARELIKDIRIWGVNVKQIAESGVINGSLLIDLENKFEEYATQFKPQWIKINSEADLPKESILQYWASEGEYIFSFTCSHRQIKQGYAQGIFTHYSPIIKPHPPKED